MGNGFAIVIRIAVDLRRSLFLHLRSVGDKMSFRSRAIDLEDEIIETMTDPEFTWFMLTMYPGIGLPLALARGGYDWYHTGEGITKSEALSIGKVLAVREAVYYGVYRSSLNISSRGYWAWKGRGGIATGQMLKNVGVHGVKGLWRIKGAIGWGLAITATGWAMTSGMEMLSDAIFGGHTDQGESTWIPPMHLW